MKTIILPLAFLALIALPACAKKTQPETATITPTSLINLNVQGMTCTGCETSIKLAVKKIAGVKKVDASFSDETATVTINPEKVQAQQIIEAINKIGYTASQKKS